MRKHGFIAVIYIGSTTTTTTFSVSSTPSSPNARFQNLKLSKLFLKYNVPDSFVKFSSTMNRKNENKRN